MRLQKATEFALYAVLELAADPQRQLTALDIAEKYNISAHHLAKVLRDLGRAGLVAAVRGVGGGYRFAGNAKRLTLLDVIRLFEEVGSEAAAPPRAPGPGIAEGLHSVLAEIDAQTVATLRSISLATMLKLAAQRPWEGATEPRAARPVSARASAAHDPPGGPAPAPRRSAARGHSPRE